ncbi:MAG: T9SS type A sorting domain-containing protein [Bacteroidales bacterium]|nr:T9SS type A sorting domain-containing protein [Bacteroidales bacterium]
MTIQKHIKSFQAVLIILLAFPVTASAQWVTVCNTGNGFVDNFEVYNNELYATGFFNTICGVSCSYVAKFDGSVWQSAGNGFPNAGHHLAAIDNELYGVAYQPHIDSNWVYKYDGTNFNKLGEGTYLTNAAVGFSQTNNLYNLIKYNGRIVACGEFDRVGSKHISGIMQWDGTKWDSLGSGLSGNITGTAPVMYPHDLCIWGTDLIVSGNFKKAGGQIVNGIARWDGTAWHGIGPGFNSTVYGICEYNGELYAGGDFTMSGTTPLNYIAKWNGTNWIDPGFALFYENTSNYSFIHTLKVLDNKLFIAGGFDRAVSGVDTMFCQGVASYDGAIIDTLYGGLPGNEVEALAIYNGLLFAGGGSNNSNSYIASYDLHTGINEADTASKTLQVYPNPASKEFTILLPGNTADISISTIYGNIVSTFKACQREVKVQLEISGIYLIQVKINDKVLTEKVIVTD